MLKYHIKAAFCCLIIISAGCSSSSKEQAAVKIAETVSTPLLVSKKITTLSQPALAMINERINQPGHDTVIEIAPGGATASFVEPKDKMFRLINNGLPDKSYKNVGDIQYSSNGKRIAYVARVNDAMNVQVVDGVEGPFFNDLNMFVFSPDSLHHAYSATAKNESYLLIDNKIRYQSSSVHDIYFTPDSKGVAFSTKSIDNKIDQFYISDLELKNKVVFDGCGYASAANDDGSHIAVACTVGDKHVLKTINVAERRVISTSPGLVNGKIMRIRFPKSSKEPIHTFLAENGARSVIYKGKIENITTGDEIFSDPLLLSNPSRVGVIIGTAVTAKLYSLFGKDDRIEKTYGFISDFIASADGRHHAYVSIYAGGEERMQIVVDGNDGPKFDKIVSPVFSPDGQLLIYRAREAGKRFLVVSDLKGKVIGKHAEHDMVFQPSFTPDGKSVAYGTLDKGDLWWRVEKLYE